MKDAPLRESIGLLVILGVLAVPLVLLTGSGGASSAEPAQAEEASAHDQVATTIKVRAAHEFEEVVLRREGEILGRVQGPARGGEIECFLDGEEEWLVVEASLKADGGETALALEFWPEGLPTAERTIWGEGKMVEELQLRWLNE